MAFEGYLLETNWIHSAIVSLLTGFFVFVRPDTVPLKQAFLAHMRSGLGDSLEK